MSVAASGFFCYLAGIQLVGCAMSTVYNPSDYNAIRDYEYYRQLSWVDPEKIADLPGGMTRAQEVAHAKAMANAIKPRYDAGIKAMGDHPGMVESAKAEGQENFERLYQVKSQDVNDLIAARKTEDDLPIPSSDSRMAYIWPDVMGDGLEGGFEDAYQDERAIAETRGPDFLADFDLKTVSAPYIGEKPPRKSMCIWRMPDGNRMGGTGKDFGMIKDIVARRANDPSAGPPQDAVKMLESLVIGRFIKD